MLKRILPICLILFLSCQDDIVSPYDECGVLNGDNTECLDCFGVINGTAVIDCEGICGGSASEDCEGLCNGESVNDECGVCNGDNSSCLDCAGVINGDSYIDMCGYCDNNPDNDCVQNCSGGWGQGAYIDDDGYCVGNSSILVSFLLDNYFTEYYQCGTDDFVQECSENNSYLNWVSDIMECECWGQNELSSLCGTYCLQSYVQNSLYGYKKVLGFNNQVNEKLITFFYKKTR